MCLGKLLFIFILFDFVIFEFHQQPQNMWYFLGEVGTHSCSHASGLIKKKLNQTKSIMMNLSASLWDGGHNASLVLKSLQKICFQEILRMPNPFKSAQMCSSKILSVTKRKLNSTQFHLWKIARLFINRSTIKEIGDQDLIIKNTRTLKVQIVLWHTYS